MEIDTDSTSGCEVLGLLGPNGAGKTTTLNMIIAELAPTKGKVKTVILK
jgi:ABC-type multidrug transport system ATPase subunit